jgi:hypothetical protein
MSDVIPPFEDPALKAYVRGAWGEVRAPSALATSIRARLAADAQAQSTPAPAEGRMRIEHWLMPVAAAAAILIALVSMLTLAGYNAGPAELPPALADALVTTHDTCSRAPDHHYVVGVAPNDVAGACARLSNQLGIAVPVPGPGDDWSFMGAGPCPVGSEKSAHLLYRRGKETLSVFSISAQSAGVADAAWQYAGQVSGHDLAGFSHDGAIYCVVAYNPSGPAASSTVQSLREQLEDRMDFTTAVIHHPTSNGDLAEALELR